MTQLAATVSGGAIGHDLRQGKWLSWGRFVTHGNGVRAECVRKIKALLLAAPPVASTGALSSDHV